MFKTGGYFFFWKISSLYIFYTNIKSGVCKYWREYWTDFVLVYRANLLNSKCVLLSSNLCVWWKYLQLVYYFSIECKIWREVLCARARGEHLSRMPHTQYSFFFVLHQNTWCQRSTHILAQKIVVGMVLATFRFRMRIVASFLFLAGSNNK